MSQSPELASLSSRVIMKLNCYMAGPLLKRKLDLKIFINFREPTVILSRPDLPTRLDFITTINRAFEFTWTTFVKNVVLYRKEITISSL